MLWSSWKIVGTTGTTPVSGTSMRGFSQVGSYRSLGPGVPAESPDRDKAACYPPDREDQQLAAREPAVQGERVQQRLVERPDREDTRQVIEEPGGDLEVGARDEHEREEDELHHCGRGFRVADEAG